MWLGLIWSVEGVIFGRKRDVNQQGLWTQAATLSWVSNLQNLQADPVDLGLANTSQMHEPVPKIKSPSLCLHTSCCFCFFEEAWHREMVGMHMFKMHKAVNGYTQVWMTCLDLCTMVSCWTGGVHKDSTVRDGFKKSYVHEKSDRQFWELHLKWVSFFQNVSMLHFLA